MKHHKKSSQRNHVISSPMVTTMVTTMVGLFHCGKESSDDHLFRSAFHRQVLLRPGHEAGSSEISTMGGLPEM